MNDEVRAGHTKLGHTTLHRIQIRITYIKLNSVLKTDRLNIEGRTDKEKAIERKEVKGSEGKIKDRRRRRRIW